MARAIVPAEMRTAVSALTGLPRWPDPHILSRMTMGGSKGTRLAMVIATCLLSTGSCGAAAKHQATMASAPAEARAERYADVSAARVPVAAGPLGEAGAAPMEPGDYDAAPAKRAQRISAAQSGQAPSTGPSQPQTGPTTTAATAAVARPKHLMLVYTANLTLAVFEAVKGLDAVESIAVEAGGYLVRRTDENIVVRVPADGFHDLLERIAKLGDELHRDVSVQDVTAEFRDLETNLQNLIAVRDRLQDLLAKAKSVPEALQVEHELTRVTGQIEQIKGRLKLLGELVAYSTISVTFQARPVEQVASTVELPFPWLGRLGLTRLLEL